MLNFKIDHNPKILTNQNFKKMAHLYDNNQLCIIDYNYEDENIEDNNINIENIMKIKLTKANENEKIPSKISYSSIYDDREKYSPYNLFKKEN